MKRTAFTLVELLVVVSIIALLTTILIPVGQRAVGLARAARCASNLHHVGTSFQAAYGGPDEIGVNTYRQYPEAANCPLIPYKTVPTPGIYVCPEDEEEDWGDCVPGLVYKSGMAPYEEIPFKHAVHCKARHGEDHGVKYVEFVMEENTGHYSYGGYNCYGADFYEDRPWYATGGPDWSNNDGLFRFYERDADGLRKFTLHYYTCGMDNKLYYYGKLIWHPLSAHKGDAIYFNDVYTSYGINAALPGGKPAGDTIVLIDYPERVVNFSTACGDKLEVAGKLDEVGDRHGERLNVLFADQSVRALGVTEAKPTMDDALWTP